MAVVQILVRGICWSTKPWPEISDYKTEEGTGTGTYKSTLTGLQSSTLYYYRAYATNAIGTGYSVPNTFTTEASITIPDYNFRRYYRHYCKFCNWRWYNPE